MDSLREIFSSEEIKKSLGAVPGKYGHFVQSVGICFSAKRGRS
jgi:hypothetical protein